MGYIPEDHEVIDRLQRVIGQTNRDKGFRDDWELARDLERYQDGDIVTADTIVFFANVAQALRTNIIGMKLALIHSEVSEMLEHVRDHGAGPAMQEKFGEEGVDVLIRTLDTLDMAGIAPGQILEAKMRFNKTRDHMHGRKA